eukprot:5995646-Amphidinium_carterae.1
MVSFSDDREVIQAAVQEDARALLWAADEMLEDPSFATEAKKECHLLKLTMLSGRSTVVAVLPVWDIKIVLYECRRRLGLAEDGTTMELWHCSGMVPNDNNTEVSDWPGVQPKGEISEYQLLIRRSDSVGAEQSYEKGQRTETEGLRTSASKVFQQAEITA